MTAHAPRDQTPPDDHLPVTPAWNCATCGAEWPCPTRRSRLLEEYQGKPATLCVYLASCLAVASEDLRGTPVLALQHRFTGWLPRQSRRF
ncbi:hypothetical protein ABTX15_24535 [Micromonospora sp. NPDC094482]|uniref:hypothetical protein n=1 Tax=unclassified Micromonospora TaxID=2617518 RepID=UPI00332B98E8